MDIAPTDIEKPPTFGGRVRNEFLLGMGHVKGRSIMLFDVDRLVSVENAIASNEAAG